MKKVKKVTVIGANGAVGSGVAGIFASFGSAIVYLVCRNQEKAELAKQKAAMSIKAISVETRLIPKTYSDLKECVEDSDLIFESVAENLEVKKEIHLQIAKYAKKDAIISTGTSGLSIDELADCYDDSKKANFLGIHFFNPPYSLTLCELIPSKYTKNSYLADIKEYLTTKLIRDVIIVKNTPAFLANRIGFRFMNEALQYAFQYKDKGGIDYIDAILGCYTGRNMPPLETVNFVGLDIHKAIVDNLYDKVQDKSFLLPDYVNELVKENKLGLKSGEGLYKKEDDKTLVYDITTKSYREKQTYQFAFQEKAIAEFKKAHYLEGFNYIKEAETTESKICITFMLRYIIYAIDLAKEISEKVSDCDIAMKAGFNWIPPLSLIEVMGGVAEVIKLCDKYLPQNDYKKKFTGIPKSIFDYRSYIKAKD